MLFYEMPGPFLRAGRVGSSSIISSEPRMVAKGRAISQIFLLNTYILTEMTLGSQELGPNRGKDRKPKSEQSPGHYLLQPSPEIPQISKALSFAILLPSSLFPHPANVHFSC